MISSTKYLVAISFSVLFSNCSEQEDTQTSKKNPRIAKTIPSIYHDRTDSGFKVSNDTIYYLDHLYSGYLISKDMVTGDTSQLGGYFNGVEEGYQRKWFEHGKLAELRFYINGKKERWHRGWWPNGKKRFEFTAYNGELEGAFREWTSDGVLIKCFHYQEGYETGSQRLWWSDGKVRANYVIKNGRKYGFLGYKICTNPYDSVKTK